VKQQAAECDVVILATHWVSVADALKVLIGEAAF
jgi:predicted dinucleotide-binding enzyme